MEDPIKKSHPLPLLQILLSYTFLLDATAESYNRDPSSQKKLAPYMTYILISGVIVKYPIIESHIGCLSTQVGKKGNP